MGVLLNSKMNEIGFPPDCCRTLLLRCSGELQGSYLTAQRLSTWTVPGSVGGPNDGGMGWGHDEVSAKSL